MAELFDSYQTNYQAVVQSSIDFSGLPHDFFLRAKADLLRELVATELPGVVKPELLDVGCGVGSFHPFLGGMTGRLCGIDVSSASIAQAQADNPQGEYRAFDGNTIPYDSGSFDLATAICVVHHVVPAQWRRFVGEMRRVVRPGGLVCVIEHNPYNPLTRLAVARCEFDKDAVLLGARKARGLMVEAGLRDVASRHFLLLPWASALTRRIEFALRHVPLGAQYAAWGRV